MITITHSNWTFGSHVRHSLHWVDYFREMIMTAVHFLIDMVSTMVLLENDTKNAVVHSLHSGQLKFTPVFTARLGLNPCFFFSPQQSGTGKLALRPPTMPRWWLRARSLCESPNQSEPSSDWDSWAVHTVLQPNCTGANLLSAQEPSLQCQVHVWSQWCGREYHLLLLFFFFKLSSFWNNECHP